MRRARRHGPPHTPHGCIRLLNDSALHRFARSPPAIASIATCSASHASSILRCLCRSSPAPARREERPSARYGAVRRPRHTHSHRLPLQVDHRQRNGPSSARNGAAACAQVEIGAGGEGKDPQGGSIKGAVRQHTQHQAVVVQRRGHQGGQARVVDHRLAEVERATGNKSHRHCVVSTS
jgi:hypothetical protein